jgi:hypothetical protein
VKAKEPDLVKEKCFADSDRNVEGTAREGENKSSFLQFKACTKNKLSKFCCVTWQRVIIIIAFYFQLSGSH